MKKTITKNSSYVIMKIFSRQDAPAKVVDAMRYCLPEARNGEYVKYFINDSIWEPGKGKEEFDLLDQWLIENGAEGGDADTAGEAVLIHYWW